MVKDKIYNKTLSRILLGIFILIIITLISIVIKDTHAFYNYEMAPVPIFTSKVGNFAGEGESVKTGPLTDKNTDVNIIFYTQMPDNKDKYMVNKYLPVTGYEVNSDKSNCYPAEGGDVLYNSYTIDGEGNLVISYTESKPTQVVCRIYYDRDKLSDVIIYAYVEDENGDRKYNDKTYKLVNTLDSSYTQMSSYECKSKTSKTTFTYDTTDGFTITSTGPDTCYAYFNKS